MAKFVWYLKQLLPLSYSSNYSTPEDGKCHATWNMWFGRVFNHKITFLN
jgi:hypothetical protein